MSQECLGPLQTTVATARSRKTDLVSVIIIFLNEERFLHEAVQSVIAQTYPNWELLLVDDGSVDLSTEIARHYAQRYPAQVRYLQHPGHQNQGMSASRNLGIAHAVGDYVAFLDADDAWFPHKLEQQVTILTSHPEAAMVFGNRQYWESWTGRPEDAQRDSISAHGVPPNTIYRPPALLLRTYAWKGTCLPIPSDLMIRREVATRVGGFEDSFRGMHEDQAFLVKVYLRECVFVADACWSRYRQHPDSCVASWVRNGQGQLATQFFLTWFEAYLSHNGMRHTEVWRNIRKALWVHQHPALAQVANLPRRCLRAALPAPVIRWLRRQWQGRERP